MLTPRFGLGEVEEFQVGFGAEPGSLLVRTSRGADFERLYRWRPDADPNAAGTLTAITPLLPHDISSFGIDRARGSTTR